MLVMLYTVASLLFVGLFMVSSYFILKTWKKAKAVKPVWLISGQAFSFLSLLVYDRLTGGSSLLFWAAGLLVGAAIGVLLGRAVKVEQTPDGIVMRNTLAYMASWVAILALNQTVTVFAREASALLMALAILNQGLNMGLYGCILWQYRRLGYAAAGRTFCLLVCLTVFSSGALAATDPAAFLPQETELPGGYKLVGKGKVTHEMFDGPVDSVMWARSEKWNLMGRTSDLDSRIVAVIGPRSGKFNARLAEIYQNATQNRGGFMGKSMPLGVGEEMAAGTPLPGSNQGALVYGKGEYGVVVYHQHTFKDGKPINIIHGFAGGPGEWDEKAAYLKAIGVVIGQRMDAANAPGGPTGKPGAASSGGGKLSAGQAMGAAAGAAGVMSLGALVQFFLQGGRGALPTGGAPAGPLSGQRDGQGRVYLNGRGWIDPRQAKAELDRLLGVLQCEQALLAGKSGQELDRLRADIDLVQAKIGNQRSILTEIDSATAGMNHYKQVVQNNMDAHQRAFDAHSRRAKGEEILQTTAQYTGTAADVSVDMLANMTGPQGKAYKAIYTTVKGAAGGASNAYFTGASVSRGALRGTLEGGVDAALGAVTDKLSDGITKVTKNKLPGFWDYEVKSPFSGGDRPGEMVKSVLGIQGNYSDSMRKNVFDAGKGLVQSKFQDVGYSYPKNWLKTMLGLPGGD